MTLIIRDAGGVARTITGLKIRDAGNVLRDISSLKVRDSGNIQRQVMSPAPGVSVWIDPASSSTRSSVSGSDVSDFTVGYSGGVAPTSYAWSVVTESPAGAASIISGASSQTARVVVGTPDPGTTATATFRCLVTIGGVVYAAQCTKTHRYANAGTSNL